MSGMKGYITMTFGSYLNYHVVLKNVDNEHEFNILPYKTFLVFPLLATHHLIFCIAFGSQYTWFQNAV